MPPPIVVVGAGAAGLMAAIFAAGTGAPVVLVERTADGGRKILISGGGRCNVLPSTLAPERFVTDSPAHVMRAMLRGWPLTAQRAFFEQTLNLPLALEAETGKLFPVSNRARDVRDALVAHARRAGTDIRFAATVTAIEASASTWIVRTERGDISASRVILATGGLSVPLTGSDGIGLRIARDLGHRIHEPYPALTPLVADPPVHRALSGISLPVRLRSKAHGRVLETAGGFLFTHRGYSGPAVLDVSHTAARASGGGDRAVIRVQWTALDADSWERRLASAAGLVLTALSAHMPHRLAAQLMLEAGVSPERRASDLRRTERTGLIDRLTSYVLPWTGDEGFRKAEVTGGGVALEEVDQRTFESRRCPGLHLCGEILDAFGPIGGHNFAWAWATGKAAGMAAGLAFRTKE